MEKNNKVMPAVALVTGIISIVTFLFYYITLPCGILAIVFGAISRKNTGSGLALTGLILGIVGLAMFALAYIFMITGIVLSN